MKSKITLLQILFLCVFVGCGIYAAKYNYDKNKTEKEIAALKNEIQAAENAAEETNGQAQEPTETETWEADGILTRYHSLYDANSDMAGWIKIDGTAIDYPVMYNGESNAYYLHRNFEKQHSSAAIPFLDYQCDRTGNCDNMIIYAHNMRNGTMFRSLLLFDDAEFERENSIIQFDTLYNRCKYEVFAAFYTAVGSKDEFRYYEFINAETEDDYNAFIDECISHSLYDTGIRPSYGELLLTLSTCSYNTNNERFVVVARMTEKI